MYYYFKTKDELAIAALAKRREQFIAAYSLLNEAIDDPRIRLVEAVRYFDKVREDYARHGSPVAKILDDTDVTKDVVAQAAAQIFADFIDWTQRQFELLGHAETARAQAITIISGIQGAIITAKTFNDPEIINAEVERLTLWIESLPNKRIQIGKIGIRPPVEA